MISSNFMDFEVVGLGGWQREEIKRALAQQADPFVTLTVHKGGPFDEALFAAALAKTREWLKPQDLKYQIWPAYEWQQQLVKTALTAFSGSYALEPAKMHELVRRYNQEKPLKDFLLLEHYCYLPIFAHEMKIQGDLYDLIKFEVSKALLEIRDFGIKNFNPGTLHTNETLDVYDKKNVKALFVHPRTMEVIKFSLQSEEARILDLLGDDVEIDFPQLLELIPQYDWGQKMRRAECFRAAARPPGPHPAGRRGRACDL